MAKIKKASDGLANAKAIIEKELTKILVKPELIPDDRDFTLKAYKLLSEDPAITREAATTPISNKSDEDLLKILSNS